MRLSHAPRKLIYNRILQMVALILSGMTFSIGLLFILFSFVQPENGYLLLSSAVICFAASAGTFGIFMRNFFILLEDEIDYASK